MTTPIKSIVIIGGGMCGLVSVIAIAKAFSSHRIQPVISVPEIRDSPSPFGSPVNLMPKALRFLDQPGLVKMRRLIILAPMENDSGWSVMRFELLKAMLSSAESLTTVQILYVKEMTKIEEEDDQVCVYLEDGRYYTVELVLGCDGIHSVTRRVLVEEDRKPDYSGWATKMLGEEDKRLFEDTALVVSRYGSVLTEFCDDHRSLIYTVLLMEMEEQGSGESAAGLSQEIIGSLDSKDRADDREGQGLDALSD
ncbi:hypothetical protein F1880_002384 [Penicillium rolfsii]|nr:hypothetical protein F1880_002384 [Penicillium rolfsii]